MGGTERQTVALAEAFARAGHEVLLVTFRPGGALAGVAAPVRRVALQPFDLGLDWFAPGLLRRLREFQPDVVQTMGRMANCHGARVARALPAARLVATFRTGKTLPRLYRATLRRAAAVVANCEEAARRLERDFGVSGPRVHAIHSGVAAPASAPADARDALRRELGTPADAVVFLCTAMMRRGKGHRRLLEIVRPFALPQPWELWLAGDGPERAACEAFARNAGLGSRVRFLGVRRDVERLYAAADLAVLASRLESLPNFLVEAQWTGLPVVACDSQGVGETFAPGRSGLLIAHGDEEGFRAALRRLAGDPALREQMAGAGRAHARARFDPGRQNRRYLDLFEQLHAIG